MIHRTIGVCCGIALTLAAVFFVVAETKGEPVVAKLENSTLLWNPLPQGTNFVEPRICGGKTNPGVPTSDLSGQVRLMTLVQQLSVANAKSAQAEGNKKIVSQVLRAAQLSNAELASAADPSTLPLLMVPVPTEANVPIEGVRDLAVKCQTDAPAGSKMQVIGGLYFSDFDATSRYGFCSTKQKDNMKKMHGLVKRGASGFSIYTNGLTDKFIALSPAGVAYLAKENPALARDVSDCADQFSAGVVTPDICSEKEKTKGGKTFSITFSDGTKSIPTCMTPQDVADGAKDVSKYFLWDPIKKLATFEANLGAAVQTYANQILKLKSQLASFGGVVQPPPPPPPSESGAQDTFRIPRSASPIIIPPPPPQIHVQDPDDEDTYDTTDTIVTTPSVSTPSTLAIPEITGTCNPSVLTGAIGRPIYWVANVSGGIGLYSYTWGGTEGLRSNSSVALGIYAQGGTKSGQVTVTSGNQTKTIYCTNTLYIGSTNNSVSTPTPTPTPIPTPTPTPTIPPSPAITTNSLIATPVSTPVEDRAGYWGIFGPGVGAYNKTTPDWHWSLTLTLTDAKTISDITVTGYNGSWSTKTAESFPLVVFKNGAQLNSAYGQTIVASKGTQIFEVYGQKEIISLAPAIVTITFTDGTRLSANASAPVASRQEQILQMASVLESLRSAVRQLQKPVK